MSETSFPDTPRVDADAKVRGQPIFCADDSRADLLHAAFASSAIAKGRIVAMDTRAASAVRGVRLVLTHENIGTMNPCGFIMSGGYGFQSFQPLLSPVIAWRGQPIALVAAETLEAAIEAAHLVQVSYEEEPFSATPDAAGAETIAQADTPLRNFIPEISRGDADAAFAAAATRIDAVFDCPAQHSSS